MPTILTHIERELTRLGRDSTTGDGSLDAFPTDDPASIALCDTQETTVFEAQGLLTALGGLPDDADWDTLWQAILPHLVEDERFRGARSHQRRAEVIPRYSYKIGQGPVKVDQPLEAFVRALAAASVPLPADIRACLGALKPGQSVLTPAYSIRRTDGVPPDDAEPPTGA